MTEPMTAEELRQAALGWEDHHETRNGRSAWATVWAERFIAAARASAPPAGVGVSVHDDIQAGELCFADQRMPIRSVLSFVRAGYTAEQIKAEYPTLSLAQIEAVMELAAPPSDPAGREEVARLREVASAVVEATDQDYDGTWVITGDGEMLISSLAEAIAALQRGTEGAGS